MTLGRKSGNCCKLYPTLLPSSVSLKYGCCCKEVRPVRPVSERAAPTSTSTSTTAKATTTATTNNEQHTATTECGVLYKTASMRHTRYLVFDSAYSSSLATAAPAGCIAARATLTHDRYDNTCGNKYGCAHLEALAFQHSGHLWAEGQTWIHGRTV